MAFCDFLTLRFSGDQLWVDRRVNVNSQATSRPTVVGKLGVNSRHLKMIHKRTARHPLSFFSGDA